MNLRGDWDTTVVTDDKLILSLLSKDNALIDMSGFYLIHLCDTYSFKKKTQVQTSVDHCS